jgi:hypothetical protein
MDSCFSLRYHNRPTTHILTFLLISIHNALCCVLAIDCNGAACTGRPCENTICGSKPWYWERLMFPFPFPVDSVVHGSWMGGFFLAYLQSQQPQCAHGDNGGSQRSFQRDLSLGGDHRASFKLNKDKAFISSRSKSKNLT